MSGISRIYAVEGVCRLVCKVAVLNSVNVVGIREKRNKRYLPHLVECSAIARVGYSLRAHPQL